MRKNILFVCVLVAIGAAVHFSNFGINVIQTDSMRPNIKAGDITITLPTQIIKPDIGKIVIARNKMGDVSLPPISHRIVATDGNDFITKGDYNQHEDTWKVKRDNVSGVVIAVIPMGWTKSPLIMSIIIFFISLIVLISMSRSTDAL